MGLVAFATVELTTVMPRRLDLLFVQRFMSAVGYDEGGIVSCSRFDDSVCFKAVINGLDVKKIVGAHSARVATMDDLRTALGTQSKVEMAASP